MTTLNVAIACLTLLAVVGIVAHALTGREATRSQRQAELALHERAQLEPTRALVAAVERLTAAADALEAATAARGPSRVGQRVTVHTKQPDDQTLFGVCVADYADRIALEDAEYVAANGATPLPGRQHIDKATIAWIDVHANVTVPDQAPATT